MAALGNLSLQLAVDIRQLLAGEKLTEEALLRIQTYADKAFTGLQKSADSASASLSRGVNRSLIETTAALEGATRGTARFVEIEARLKGIDITPDLQAQINALKALEAQQKSNIANNINHGKSAKELGFALRNVPAQFSDIVVSLQGGQKPLTIFLQQGAQLKDLFGGAGNAARALGGYVLGLISPFTIAIAAVVGLGAAYAAGANESTRLNTALITSGNIADGTVGKFTQLAGEVGRATGLFGTARDAMEALAGSGIIAGRDIPNALKGIVAGAALTGKSAQDVTKDFEKLATDPLKGLLELNKTQNFLTVATYEQIKALEKQGKTQDAATLAQETYANVLQSRRNEVVENLGLFERAWKAIKEESGFALDNILKIGRVGAPAEQLSQERFNLSRLQSGGFMSSGKGSTNEIADQQAKIANLEHDFARSAARAAATGSQRERNKQVIGGLAFLDEKTLANNPIEKINREFAPALAVFAKGTKEFNDLIKLRDEAIKKINDKAAAPGIREQNKLATAYENIKEKALDFIRTQQQEIAQQDTVRSGQKLSAELLDFIADKKGKYSKAVLDTIASLAGEVAANDQIIESQQAREKAEKELLKVREQTNESLQKSLDVSQDLAAREQDRVADIQRQIDVFGQSEQAVSALEAAKLLDATATYEQSIALMQANGATQEQIDWTYQQIEAIKARGKAIEQYGIKSAELEGLKEAKKQAEELRKTNEKLADDFSKSLTDAIFRGFEKGKSFAKNFRDTLVNSFKTLVLQPLIKFAVDASGITGVLGSLSGLFSGSAAASTGGGSALSSISGIGNLFTKGNNAIVGAIEGLGTFLSTGNGGLGDILGGFLGQNASGLSTAIPYAGALFQALTGNIAGGALTAIGTAIGGPIGGVIGGLVGGLIGGGKKSYPNAQFSSSYANGIYTQGSASTLARGNLDNGAVASLSNVNEVFAQRIGTLFKAYGLSDSIGFYNQVKAGKNLQAAFTATLSNGKGFGIDRWTRNLGPTSEAAMQEFVNEVLGRGIAGAIQQSDLSAGIKKFFDGMVDPAQAVDAINTLVGLKTSLLDLPPVFDAIRNAIDTTAYKTSIADLKTRFAAIGTYTSLFYSEQENFDTFTKQLVTQLTSLNTALPASRDQFRALVDGINVIDEASSNQFNGLVALAPAMDTYFKQLQKQADATKEASDAAKLLADSLSPLRDESLFNNLFDYNLYKGIADNYGTSFANKFQDGYTPTYGASNNTSVNYPFAVTPSNNTAVSTSDPNMLNAMSTLIATVNALQNKIAQIESNTKMTAQMLVNVSPDGTSIQTVAAP